MIASLAKLAPTAELERVAAVQSAPGVDLSALVGVEHSVTVQTTTEQAEAGVAKILAQPPQVFKAILVRR